MRARLSELSEPFFSDPVLRKAARMVRNGAVTKDEKHESVYWVSGETGDYRVQFGEHDTFVTCTCAHGLNVGAGDARCSHVAAAIAVREAEPTVVITEESPPPDKSEWNTRELQQDFEVMGFSMGLVVVKRKDTDEVGTLQFDHSPRRYYGWQAD